MVIVYTLNIKLELLKKKRGDGQIQINFRSNSTFSPFHITLKGALILQYQLEIWSRIGDQASAISIIRKWAPAVLSALSVSVRSSSFLALTCNMKLIEVNRVHFYAPNEDY